MAGATDAAHEDADLFALIEAERALAPKVEEAERVEEEVKERTEWPEPPQTLLVTEDDNKVLWRPKNNRVYWCEFDRKELQEAAINLFGRAPLKTCIPTRPDLIAYQSRSEQIVEALNQVKIARELAKERSGLAEAERLWTTLNAEHRQLWLRIAKTPARTPAGLLAKLSVVAAANCYQDEEDRDWGDRVGGGHPCEFGSGRHRHEAWRCGLKPSRRYQNETGRRGETWWPFRWRRS